MAHTAPTADEEGAPGPAGGIGRFVADRVRRSAARLLSGLAGRALDERDRWPLWLPVALGFGIAVYFSLRAEPALWLGPTMLVCAVALALIGRRGGWRVSALLLGAAATGFCAAQWRTASVAAPQLGERFGPASFDGRVISVERRGKARRVVIGDLRIEKLAAEHTPRRIRLTDRVGGSDLRAGDRIVGRAVLLPVPAPVQPGAYDFQRAAYFAGIGASGFTVGRLDAYRAEATGGSVSLWLQRVREVATERIVAALGTPAGGVAAALLTGERGHIPKEVMEQIRAAGLAHLLAISGLHIGMIAGFAFFGVRLALALIPGLALRHPIRKWAALAALAVAFTYLLLSGATVPTQRAFLMLAVVLFAVLIDRVALSMRLVAWAAAALLLVAPETLLTPSFQMSFAAVVALIAAYEAWAERRRANPAPRTIGIRARDALLALVVTSLVAGLATAPFSLFHFQKAAIYGLAANLLAVPMMTLWIMPLGLIALIALPFGLADPILALMGAGIDAMLAVAETVSGWPSAHPAVMPPTVWGLAILTVGGLWLCLWRGRWRWWGLPLLAAGVGSAWTVTPPDLLVSDDGKLTAIRRADGTLALSSKRRGRFAARQWLARLGQEKAPLWTLKPATGPPPVRCDPGGCLWRRDGMLIAFPVRPEAVAQDCFRADLIVTPLARPPDCPRPRLVIDRAALRRGGAHLLRLRGSGILVATDRADRGDRPWVVQPLRRAKTALGWRRIAQNWRMRPTSRP